MDVRRLVGINFRALRTARGLTQEQAAELTGVSQQYISGLEQGRRNPTVVSVHDIAQALGVEYFELLKPPKKKV